MPSRSAPAAPPTFSGFGPEALLFYEGLEADNSRPYWSDHLPDHERAVRGPMAALVHELEPEFGGFKVFRPNRDVRFSKDKSPYKTHAGAATRGPAAYYVQIGADGLMVACGMYRMERDQLERYRAAVADETSGPVLAAIVDGLVGSGHALMGETLVRAPAARTPATPAPACCGTGPWRPPTPPAPRTGCGRLRPATASRSPSAASPRCTTGSPPTWARTSRPRATSRPARGGDRAISRRRGRRGGGPSGPCR